MLNKFSMTGNWVGYSSAGDSALHGPVEGGLVLGGGLDAGLRRDDEMRRRRASALHQPVEDAFLLGSRLHRHRRQLALAEEIPAAFDAAGKARLGRVEIGDQLFEIVRHGGFPNPRVAKKPISLNGANYPQD